MLVLRRHVDDRIVIGDVTIVVVAIEGNRVRLGVEAPPDVEIQYNRLNEMAPRPALPERRQAAQ